MLCAFYFLITIGSSIVFHIITSKDARGERTKKYGKMYLCGCAIMFMIFLSDVITVAPILGKVNLFMSTIGTFSIMLSSTSFLLIFVPMVSLFFKNHREKISMCYVMVYYVAVGTSFTTFIAFIIKAFSNWSWFLDVKSADWFFWYILYIFFTTKLPYPRKLEHKGKEN